MKILDRKYVTMQKMPRIALSDPISSHSSLIRAELCSLQLPLFALKTKGLQKVTGFDSEGTLNLGTMQKKYGFYTLYKNHNVPGILSYSLHTAFLSMVAEKGFPFVNPITWRWRDLCDRLSLSCSGRILQQLKHAILATLGIQIFSSQALYASNEKGLVLLDGQFAIYEKVKFASPQSKLPQANSPSALWLSEWYVSNLNTGLMISLDYDIWRRLNKKSPIASRLYELLLVNSHNFEKELAVSYGRLVEILPIRRERYFSDAKKQLKLAFAALLEAGLIGTVEWREDKASIAHLTVPYGPVIRSLVIARADAEDESISSSLRQFVSKSGIFQVAVPED